MPQDSPLSLPASGGTKPSGYEKGVGMDADGTGGDDDIRKDLSCNVSDSTRPNAEAVSGKLAAPASLRLIPASHAWQQTRQPQLGTIGLGRFSAVRATRARGLVGRNAASSVWHGKPRHPATATSRQLPGMEAGAGQFVAENCEDGHGGEPWSEVYSLCT